MEGLSEEARVLLFFRGIIVGRNLGTGKGNPKLWISKVSLRKVEKFGAKEDVTGPFEYQELSRRGGRRGGGSPTRRTLRRVQTGRS